MYTRIAAALVVAFLLAAGAWKAYRMGESSVQIQWDKQIAEMTTAALAESEANRAKEQALQTKVIKAQNESQARNKALQVAANSARAESDSLRSDIATIRSRLPSLADDAVRKYADAASVVFDNCQREYSDMASKADGHASDAKTLIDAWPK